MGCSCQSPAPQMVVYDPRYFQMQVPVQPVLPAQQLPAQDDRTLMPMPGGMPGIGGGVSPMPGGMPGIGGGVSPLPGGIPGIGGGVSPLPGGIPGIGGGVSPLPGGIPGIGGGGIPGIGGGGIPGIGGGGIPGIGGGGIPGQGGGVPAQLSQANLPSVLAQFPRPVGQPPAEMLFLFNHLRRNPQMIQAFIRQRPQSLQQAVQFAQFGTMGPREDEDRLLPGFCYNRWSLIFTFNNVFLMFPVANLFGFVIGYCFPLTPCIIPDFSILFAFC